MIKTLHITNSTETVIPVTYVERYADPTVKSLIHKYKFEPGSISARNALSAILTDICIETIQLQAATSIESTLFFISPPSTMYARREKPIDSMWELLVYSLSNITRYGKTTSKTHVLYGSIFKIAPAFLKSRRAQHIGGTRASRLQHTESRYTIRIYFKIQLTFLIHVKKVSNFSFCIIDDVASTGGTLLACKDTLCSYMQQIQKKKPEISFDIQVFSISH